MEHRRKQWQNGKQLQIKKRREAELQSVVVDQNLPVAAVVNSPSEIIAELKKQTDSVIVSYSCGKDSLALLDFCKKNFKRVEAFFMYIVKGLNYFENKIKYAENLFNIKIKQYPHPELSILLNRGICAFEAAETKILRWTDIENKAREDFKIDWILSGWKKSDSLQRRGALSTYRMHAISDKSKKAYPLSSWNDKNVLSYLRLNKIIAPHSGSKKQFEISLEYDRLFFFKENYPNDYKLILKSFPFAEAIIKRKEFYGSN